MEAGGPRTPPSPERITQLLDAWRAGDSGALERLLPLVYSQLRSLAESHMRRERRGHTLQPTAVVHEACLRLMGREPPSWKDRAHFFAVAARLMRRVLVDHARSRRAAKRGGGEPRVLLREEWMAPAEDGGAEPVDLLDLDAALSRLAALDERKARVIELRYFGGLTVEETAEVVGVSRETVHLDSRMARAWLRDRLRPAGAEP